MRCIQCTQIYRNLLFIRIKESRMPAIIVSMKRQLVMFGVLISMPKISEVVVAYKLEEGIVVSDFMLLVVGK